MATGGASGAKADSPDCRVCFPPDNTPRGRVPVGVRPLSVSTFSLSSLAGEYKHQNITLGVKNTAGRLSHTSDISSYPVSAFLSAPLSMSCTLSGSLLHRARSVFLLSFKTVSLFITVYKSYLLRPRETRSFHR